MVGAVLSLVTVNWQVPVWLIVSKAVTVAELEKVSEVSQLYVLE